MMPNKKYLLLDTNTGKLHKWNLNTILRNINRDRSNGWISYNATDWQEGLETFTEYTLLKEG